MKQKSVAAIKPRKAVLQLPKGTVQERVTKGKLKRAAKLDEEFELLDRAEPMGEAERVRLERMGLMPDDYTLNALRVLKAMGEIAIDPNDDKCVQAASLYLKYTLPQPEQKHNVASTVTVRSSPDLTHLSDEELVQYRALVAKTTVERSTEHDAAND